jgi:uncharacterized protein YcgI (DUF1989 family)
VIDPTHFIDQGTPDGTNATLHTPISPNGVPVLNTLYEVPARQGRAFRLKAGQTIRVINPGGSQVADFWAFNADDPREYLSMEHMRPTLKRMMPRPGDRLVTNRRRPILCLTADTSPGVHDTLIACCDVHRYHLLGVNGYHDNCTDNLRMAMLAIGRRAAEIPCPLNLWMNTPPQADGTIAWREPVSGAGDYVDMQAEIDCIVVISACPMDILPINGADAIPRELHVEVRQPSVEQPQ